MSLQPQFPQTQPHITQPSCGPAVRQSAWRHALRSRSVRTAILILLCAIPGLAQAQSVVVTAPAVRVVAPPPPAVVVQQPVVVAPPPPRRVVVVHRPAPAPVVVVAPPHPRRVVVVHPAPRPVYVRGPGWRHGGPGWRHGWKHH